MAYTDCTWQLLTNGDPRLCDCNRIIGFEVTPFANNSPDKQKELALKTDWKYIVAPATSFYFQETLQEKGNPVYRQPYIPLADLSNVFHPPCYS